MKRAVVFAHYDPHGVVDPYVLVLLESLKPHAARLIFVSTAAANTDFAAVSEICDAVIVRDNVGYDFASWKQGIGHLGDLGQYDELLFVNDSVYGPFHDLRRVFHWAGKQSVDFWGLTANHELAFHIQSYFFCFRRSLVDSGFFERFWQSVTPLNSRQAIIEAYELGLTRRLQDENARIGCLFDPFKLKFLARLRAGLINGPHRGFSRRKCLRHIMKRRPLNPTHMMWRSLVEAGAPFVKIELLRSNPENLELKRVMRYLARCRRYNVELIRGHLSRVGESGSQGVLLRR